MSVAQIIERTGFDITLNQELLLGMDLAVLHYGGCGHGSGFLMVRQDPNEDVDEFGRQLYEWRIMDASGETIGQGDEFRDLNGGNHPMEVLAALIDHLLEYAETEVDAYNDGFEAVSGDWLWDLQNYIAPALPIAKLRQAIECLDVIDAED